MPHIKKLSRVGNSTAVLLDKPFLQQLDLNGDSEVEISIQDDAIVIRPHRYLAIKDTRVIGQRIAEKRRKTLERLAR